MFWIKYSGFVQIGNMTCYFHMFLRNNNDCFPESINWLAFVLQNKQNKRVYYDLRLNSLYINLLKPTGHVMHQQFNIQHLLCPQVEAMLSHSRPVQAQRGLGS